MITLSPHEEIIAQQIQKLKDEAGSHSPSILTLQEQLPELKVRVDACFLSNPLATDLFVRHFKEELIDTNKIKDLLEFYPSQNQVISKVLAHSLDVSPEEVFIGNGAIEIVQAIIHRFARKRLLINIPTFSSYYEFAPQSVEVSFHQLPAERDYQLDISAYLRHVRQFQPDTVVLINPNNPDGGYIPIAQIEALLNGLQDVETVIIDESFIHFAYENDNLERVSAMQFYRRYSKNLIVLKSMSKDFGVAGIRAGFAVMARERVHELLRNGYLWNSNSLAEYFFRLYARKEFSDQYEQVRKQYIQYTQEFFQDLGQIASIQAIPSKANFVLIKLPEQVTAATLTWKLLIRYGIYTRTGSDKIGLKGHYIRIASRTRNDNRIITRCLQELFGVKDAHTQRG